MNTCTKKVNATGRYGKAALLWWQKLPGDKYFTARYTAKVLRLTVKETEKVVSLVRKMRKA